MEDERRYGNGRRNLDDLTNRVGNVEATQGRVIDLLMGPEVEDVDGTTKRNTEEGMDHKVDVLYDQSQNGGLRARLSRLDRFFIAGIGAAAVVGSAWIASI